MIPKAAHEMIDFIIAWGAITALVLIILEPLISPQTRHRWASFLLRAPTDAGLNISSVSEFATTFIQNTIFRWFGPNPWSAYAFLKSVILSILVFACLLAALYGLYSFNALAAINSETVIIDNKLWLLGALFFVFIADYFSYLVTYNLMRFAINARSFGQMIFLAVIDIFSSLYVFLLIFPMVLMSLYIGFFTTSYRVAGLYGLMNVPDESFKIMVRYSLDNNKYATWLDFLDNDRYKIGNVAMEFLLSAEINAGSHLGDPLFGVNQVYPIGGEAVVTLSGVLRYHGLKLNEIGEFVAAHNDKQPDREVAKLFIPPTDSGVKWLVILTPSFTEYLKTRWNLLNLFMYRMDYVTKKAIIITRPRRFWRWLSEIYENAFQAAQRVQENFFPVMALKPVRMALFGGGYAENDGMKEDASWLDSKFGGKARTSLFKLYWDYCDDKLYVGEKVLTLDCDRRVVFLGRGYAASELPLTRISKGQWMPIGLFFATSASVTLVFYVFLFVFVSAGYFVRGVFLLIPAHFRTRTRSAAVDRYIVQLLLVISALGLTILLTVVSKI